MIILWNFNGHGLINIYIYIYMKGLNNTYWILLIILIIVEVSSITMIKYAAMNNDKILLIPGIIGFGVLGYILFNIFNLGSMAVTNAIWDILSIIIITIIAITLFEEKIDIYHGIGLFFAILALLLVNKSDIQETFSR